MNAAYFTTGFLAGVLMTLVVLLYTSEPSSGSEPKVKLDERVREVL